MDKKLKYGTRYDPDTIKRETTWRVLRLGLFSLGVVALVFWLGLALFPLSARLPASTQTASGERPLDWGNLDSVTGLLTTALVLGGLVFAFMDHIQNAVEKKQQNAQASYNIFKDVFERMMSPSAQASRRWIIQNIPTLQHSGLERAAWLALAHERLHTSAPGQMDDRAPGVEHLKEVLNTLDFIGFVARHYWSMNNELIFWLSPSVAKVWERVEPYVEEEASLRGEPDYYEAAREFGGACLRYRREHFGESRIIEQAT